MNRPLPGPDETRTYLFIINDGPYGQERPYTALRLAVNLAKRRDLKIRVHLAGDGLQALYAFDITDALGRLLVEGRAAVVLDARAMR